MKREMINITCKCQKMYLLLKMALSPYPGADSDYRNVRTCEP